MYYRAKKGKKKKLHDRKKKKTFYYNTKYQKKKKEKKKLYPIAAIATAWGSWQSLDYIDIPFPPPSFSSDNSMIWNRPQEIDDEPNHNPWRA